MQSGIYAASCGPALVNRGRNTLSWLASDKADDYTLRQTNFTSTPTWNISMIRKEETYDFK